MSEPEILSKLDIIIKLLATNQIEGKIPMNKYCFYLILELQIKTSLKFWEKLRIQ